MNNTDKLISALKDNILCKNKLIAELNEDNFKMAEYLRELLGALKGDVNNKLDNINYLINKYSRPRKLSE